jgi:hypothetical protein
VLRLAVVALALVACALPQPRWSGENLHVVDGYWVGTEQQCSDAVDWDCEAAVKAALSILAPVEAGDVIGTWIAPVPTSYVDPDGREHIQTRAGLLSSTFVIFDLGGGHRRAVGVDCGRGHDPGGVEMTLCRPSDLSRFSVTRQPGFDP